MELKVYMCDTMGSIVIKNPSADFDAWIDDITIEAEADNDDELVFILSKATTDTVDAFRDELKFEFSEKECCGYL